ncbi:MAG: SDR family NAD(P)-dependent oxidoreductase, partial [Chitinophagaceae bacterium]|nr:SDR family NAD(P)-dependent oxidoreductase [Rubrivivax sp.]
ARGARLCLLARRADALRSTAADLTVRGATLVNTHVYDAEAAELPDALVQAAWLQAGGFDIALIAHGVLPDQGEAETSTAAALRSFDINARSVLAVLTPLANLFEAQGRGVIGVISSPAGDRGRASNYVYGTAKAAVSNLCSGLRHRLVGKGVRVLTILPGFVDTPMTASLPKGPLWAKPDRVAADIERALARKNGVLYTPWFWRWIMLLVLHLPQALFLRTRL